MNISAQVWHFSPRFPLIFLVILCQGLILAGCSTHSALMDKQVAQQTRDQELIQQVTSALDATEARFAKAQAANVGTFAPSPMANAESALREARRYTERFQNDPDMVRQSMSLFFGETMGDKTLGLIAEANDALSRAEEHKQQADAIFAAADENFVWLNKFQTPLYFPYEYADLQRTRQALVEDVASGQLDQAQKRLPQFLSEQHALEIMAAQRFYLHDVGLRVAQEGRSQLERYAPISYSSALGALNKAKALIAQDPRAEDKILSAKANTEFTFEVAHAVATDMQRLTNMDRQNMERWLILVTARLNEMGRAIGAPDVRNKELTQQLELLAQAAANPAVSVSEAPQPAAAPVAAVEPPAPPATAPTAAPATATEGAAMDQRMTQLEQSLAEQIKALSEQINAMQQMNVSVQAAPAAEVQISDN